MSRRAARELALKVLFQIDVGYQDPEVALALTLAGDKLDEDTARFAGELVRGTVRHLAAIDDTLSRLSPEWSLRQMAGVDRNVLRLGAYELMFHEGVPDAVAINEAVDLAKVYSTPESGRFVNGILGALAKELARLSRSEPESRHPHADPPDARP